MKAVKASEYGILSNGKIYSNRINALLNTAVSEVIFDDGPVTIMNDIIVPKGKTLTFLNDSKIISTSTNKITGGYINCDYRKQCFDESVTVEGLENDVIYPGWFGMKSDAHWLSPYKTDNYPIMMKAMAAGRGSIKIAGSDIVDGLGNWFWFSQGFRFTGSRLIGEGIGRTILVFPSNQPGITLASNGALWQDFTVSGGFGTESNGYNSDTAHGALISGNGNILSRIEFKNFDGDGTALIADVNARPYTNANLNILEYCVWKGNGRHGISAAGGDVNQCLVLSPNFVGQGRHAVYDKSFLGITVINPHSASNGIDHSKNKTTIIHNGVPYHAIKDNKGVEPGVSADSKDYWEANPKIYPPHKYLWNDSDQYYSGGSYVTIDRNQRGVYVGPGVSVNPYLEGDEAGFQNRGVNNLILNGFGGGGGNIPGGIGVSDGDITALVWQALNNGISTRISDKFMGVRDGDWPFGWKYDEVSKSWYLTWANFEGNRTLQILAPNANPERIGRKEIPRNGVMLFQNNGLYISDGLSGKLWANGLWPPEGTDFNKGDRVYNTDIESNGIDFWQWDGTKWVAYKAVKN